MMIPAIPDAFGRCAALYEGYPLAVGVADGLRRMVLMTSAGRLPAFHDLIQDGPGTYVLQPWGKRPVAEFTPGSGPAMPPEAAAVLAGGVPLPRDGSLVGFFDGTGHVAAVLATSHEPPRPAFSMMPRADLRQTEWPPATDEPSFGPWFWQLLADEAAADLEPFIVANPGAAYAATGETVPGGTAVVITEPLLVAGRYILPAGVFVHWRELARGETIPPIGDLLRQAENVVDLAASFTEARE